jgi:hypothetical protein
MPMLGQDSKNVIRFGTQLLFARHAVRAVGAHGAMINARESNNSVASPMRPSLGYYRLFQIFRLFQRFHKRIGPRRIVAEKCVVVRGER